MIVAGLVVLLLAFWWWVGLPRETGKIISPIGQEKGGATLEDVQLEELTMERIFMDDHSFVTTLPAEKKTTLIATGDVIPARVVNYKATNYKDFLWPWRKTAETLSEAEITFINLEAPIFEGCAPTNAETLVFCGDAKHIEGLKYAGVDVVSLANNHTGDFGKEGLQKTTELLTKNGITYTGVNGASYLDAKGKRWAFLGYNDITPRVEVASRAEEEKIQNEITEAREQSDIVIVTYHWGTEYISEVEERQQKLGRLAVDAGADLVIGNHPHWVKPIEIYKGKLITYAHGNFIFDQEWSQRTKEGVVGRYTFFENRLIDAEFLPVEIRDFGQPVFLSGKEREKVLGQLR